MDAPREFLSTRPLSFKVSSESQDSSRILPTSPRKSAAEPEYVPIPTTASGTAITSPNLLNGVLRAASATISVSGQIFSIPSPDSCIFASSLAIASNYLGIFRLTSVEFPSIQQLEELFKSARSFFAPEAFEAAALESAKQFAWSDEILNRDRDLLLSLGSLDAVLTFHMDHHRTVGMNSSRVREWLSADPRLDLLVELADYGGVVDVDDDFIPFRHSGPLRPLQQRLLPVYRKHAHKLWSSGKGLLLRVSDIPPHILASMHTGNSCHLVPKPDTPEGRFIIDASNVSEGRIPLNGLSAKEKAIARYGQVVLPTIRDVLVGWNTYRLQWQLQWSDMIIFKEDIKGCFNQLRWSIPSAKLLGSMVDDDVVFVMVTGGFGHTSTPMQWDVFGQAIRRRVKHGSSPELAPTAPLCDQGPLLCPLDIYVDDSFGAGRPDHVQVARERVVLVTEGVLAPGTSISLEKRVLSPAADILGYHVDCITASIRPKDRAIDKLFFVLFSFDVKTAQPLVLWQCLSSLVNMYSHVVRGMRPFVAAIIHMTHRASGKYAKRAQASASAIFAIEMWRAAIILLASDYTCLAVPLDLFILSATLTTFQFKIISDASPWRLAAGLYDYDSGRLLCWSTLLLPFAPTDAHRFQTQREYLGHLFSLLLMLSHCKCNQLTQIVSYQWVNDNTGAIEWVNTHKCSSQSSLFACMAVSQLNLLTNIWAADAVHIPGETMGEIDAMSRIERQSDPFIACPSLTSDLFIPLEDPAIIELFRLCDPSVTQSSSVEHHSSFCDVLSRINRLITVLSH